MPKYKIRETFSNGKTHSMNVATADEATALLVAQTLLGGQVEVLEAPANITVSDPSLTNVSYKRFDIMGKNVSTGDRTYFTFLGKATVTDIDVKNYFVNKTINGVHLDEVTVSVRSYTI